MSTAVARVSWLAATVTTIFFRLACTDPMWTLSGAALVFPPPVVGVVVGVVPLVVVVVVVVPVLPVVVVPVVPVGVEVDVGVDVPVEVEPPAPVTVSVPFIVEECASQW